jgi:hypothetical protein
VLNSVLRHEDVWGSWGIAPRINLGTRWKWGLNAVAKRKKSLLRLGIEPQSSSPYLTHYTDWATASPLPISQVQIFSSAPCSQTFSVYILPQGREPQFDTHTKQQVELQIQQHNYISLLQWTRFRRLHSSSVRTDSGRKWQICLYLPTSTCYERGVLSGDKVEQMSVNISLTPWIVAMLRLHFINTLHPCCCALTEINSEVTFFHVISTSLHFLINKWSAARHVTSPAVGAFIVQRVQFR